jgi:xanthine dehydrogenase YagT iron-sulfur-binding subunit
MPLQGTLDIFMKHQNLILVKQMAYTNMGEIAVSNQTKSGADTSTIRAQLHINGELRTLQLDTRTTLLDALREQLGLTGSKKGCDQGQCGACTVHVNGRRTLACLSLAVAHQQDEITTIEGLLHGEELHPMQSAFIECDAFQCGYCTPGQIMSAVAMLEEAANGVPSHATLDVAHPPAAGELSAEEIRERMSGNICRCGAYPNIVEAIDHVQSVGQARR